ncbi:MAG TPA: DUF4097 family beta strand repeat-containing protein [Pyrinomonadaceae bacterium]|nr:DUF4097 family beta strand repeat-containing protein [Pyrinomonadaceae bacterium]
MKRFLCAIAVIALLAPARVAYADSPKSAREDGQGETVERAVAAEPGVVVSLCVGTGDVFVRGWDKREVRARARVERLELRRQQANAPQAPGPRNPPDAPNRRQPANVPGPPGPVSAPNPPGPPLPRSFPGIPNPPGTPNTPNAPQAGNVVAVILSNAEEDGFGLSGCDAVGSVELDVPRGATVVLRVREGDVDVSDVAAVHVETMQGDTDVRGVSRSVEVESMSGSIFLRDSGGRVRLRTFHGDVEAVNVRAVVAADQFQAKSTNGSVKLEQVGHTHVEAATVSGDVSVTGALARGGSYHFQTFNGDVTLMLPATESFKLNARVAVGGEISTDFAVKSAGGAQPSKELGQGRLVGTVGGGGAEVNLASFNGTLRLKKQ